MINLWILSNEELEQLDAAFTLMVEAITMLERRGVLAPLASVDLANLYDDLNAEQESRRAARKAAAEDAEWMGLPLKDNSEMER